VYHRCFFSVATLIVAYALTACSTPPAPTPKAEPVATISAQPPPGPSLADQIQEAIAAIDLIILRYDTLLTTIERLPSGKPAEKIFEEVGAYIGGDLFESVEPPNQDRILATIAKSFSFATQVVMIEAGVQADLISLSDKLVDLNARTADLSSRFDQGKTVRTYARKVRRELMPLMAQLRAMARADTTDREGISKLDAETKKIVALSRQSLQALERETRSIETELGGK